MCIALWLIFVSINDEDDRVHLDDDDVDDDDDDDVDLDDDDKEELLLSVVCVHCGVQSGLSSYQSNYASCNAQMNTNDCDDADNDKSYLLSRTALISSKTKPHWREFQ